MVFEDFEDSVSFAAKNWYFSADTAAQINYPTLLSNYWDAVVDNSDRNGHVFSGYFSTEPGGYVIFGTRISTEGIDMSDLDSSGLEELPGSSALEELLSARSV